ncbi:condensin-2 complex subunit D3 isoform X1 [Xyrichtys novacula]|uniref:Condensin-2 complex subunit D3 isoform X1 n=1 Tax=Xyrichtys novacula TaxID=13765 RepID=A0AAV1FZ08_XYRNO|nr:condensin-2 complex subunit D3 isoform X1 [Xyrichtys novacula]
MDLLSALRFLRLNEIPAAWVDEVWDLEFTERKQLDDTIAGELEVVGEKDFRKLYQCLLTHAAEQQHSAGIDGASQSVWAMLGSNAVSVKSLVAVLSFFILAGKAKMANGQVRVSALHAASVYLLLLGIPGSIVHKVFHEILLDTCLDLTSHCWPQDCGKKRKKDSLKSLQAEGKRSKPQRRDALEMEVDEAEDEEDEEPHFSSKDLMKIRGAVVYLVQSLLRLLQTFSLKNRQQSASNCTQIFSKLLYFEPVVGQPNFAVEQDITKLRNISEMAFYGLRLLCSPKHGDQKESLRGVFHRLLYVILMMNKGTRGKPSLLVPNQAVLATRNQAISFICHLMGELKELALPFLQILLQHICYQMVEKSEYRSHGAQAVGMLTSQMENKDYADFIKWLFNFSRCSKMAHRLFSADVVMVLLELPERTSEDCQDPELASFLPHKFLIQDLLFPRRMDDSPTVQGHVFNCLAQCLELPSLNVTRAVHSLFSATGTHTELESEITEETLCSQQTQKTYRSLPFQTVEITTTNNNNSSSSTCAKENLAHLLEQVKDPMMNVRKSALQALSGLLKHGVIPTSSENLTTLSERCRDPAVSVKKKALQCLGELLAAKPECSVVQKTWLQGVLPAVMDSESSVQEKALGALDQMLLGQVKPYSAGRHIDPSQKMTWALLDLLCHECQNLRQYFSRALTIWSKQNMFTPTFISNLISHTEADHAEAAWLLLSKAVALSPTLPCGKILDAWDNMISSKDLPTTTCCHILCVMGDMAAHLNMDTKDRIVADLMSWLKTFTLSLEVISAAVETLFQLGHSQDFKQTQAFLNQHCGELVSVSEAYLAEIILSGKGTQNLNVELMIKHLHTLGATSLHCPAKISKRTVLLVESVLTVQADRVAELQKELPASQPLSQFRANSLPTRIRAHGVITLGKLCLQHENLVQKYLPVFARELEVGTEIAEEFVKWKGALFFRFMVALVDPVPAIASLCEYCLLNVLLKKNPEMFSQHFIEGIFHFNSYDKHKTYNKFPQSERERVKFSLKGAQNCEKRFRIYCFLLEHFTDAQRFNIVNKINQSVLACFADEELPLDADGAEILSETFHILSLKEMKLQAVSHPAESSAEEETGEENMAKVVLQAAQKKMVSQVQKKAFIENMVPVIISLKSLLEQKRSPVLRDLMSYLQVTMKDYRNEVKEFFSGDDQLAAEVEFALKTAEREREMEEQMDNCSLSREARTPTAQHSVYGSPIKSRPLLPFIFATPQPPQPNLLSVRQAFTDGRVRRSREEEGAPTKSITLEGTVMPKGAMKDRAVSTPVGFNINCTFDEGLSAISSDQGTSGLGETSVLHVRSNEQQAPGQRHWNVQSPLRRKRKPKF